MDEVEITDTLTLRIDTMGRVTILQYDPIISPRVAVSTISVSLGTADKLLKELGDMIKLHDANEWYRRRVG